MQQDNPIFWDNIRKYEERLAKNPESFIFARLAEAYLKVGLIDDAVNCARQGVARHPAYIAGQRALALASHAKGNQAECLQALEQVSAAIPEDAGIQKMLGKLLFDAGNYEQAGKAFRTALDFHPDDAECKTELESLDRHTASLIGTGERIDTALPISNEDQAEEIIEDLEIIELGEADMLEEYEPEGNEPAPANTAPEVIDPLSTATLAELYVQQGFIDRALDIYRVISADDPGNAQVLARIAALEEGLFKSDANISGIAAANSGQAASPATPEEADSAAAMLEGWLDNIRRIKQCR